MPGLPSESTLALAVVTLSVGAGVVASEVVGHRFEEKVEAVGMRLLARTADEFLHQQGSEEEKLAAALEPLMASRELRAAFLARDRPRLQRLAQPILEAMREHSRITHWYFHEPGSAPSVFLRVHRPELFGDTPARLTLRRAAAGNDRPAGLEMGLTALALRVVRPWIVDGTLIGYLELAEEIDHFLQAMKARTGDDYALVLDKRHFDAGAWRAAAGSLATRWNDRPESLVLDATAPEAAALPWPGDLDALPAAGLQLGEVAVGDRALLRGVFLVRDASGRRIGALQVVHDFSSQHQAVREGRLLALATTVLAALAAAGGVVLLVHLLVFRRVVALRRRLEERGSASRPPATIPAPPGHDDLGRLESLFERALARQAAPPAAPPDGPEPPGHRG
jgi:hypothetical protein